MYICILYSFKTCRLENLNVSANRNASLLCWVECFWSMCFVLFFSYFNL